MGQFGSNRKIKFRGNLVDIRVIMDQVGYEWTKMDQIEKKLMKYNQFSNACGHGLIRDPSKVMLALG